MKEIKALPGDFIDDKFREMLNKFFKDKHENAYFLHLNNYTVVIFRDEK